jgi:hypothetical protein
MKGRIGLDQGFEQGILFRGPFFVAVFGHGKPTPAKPRIIIAQVEGSGDATRGAKRRVAWSGVLKQ